MKLTKYQHACFTVENDGKLLVVDPGGLSGDFIAPDHVVAIVITHEHGDHFDTEQIAAIIDKNPNAVIIAHPDVTTKIEAFEARSVQPGDMVAVGPFNLEFFGGHHAVIHDSMPIVANLGVLINDLIYYPGDSFTSPDRAVDTLALPAGAPWLKIGEAMDYLAEVRPRLAFPTHDAVLSDAGKGFVDTLLSTVAKNNAIDYQRIENSIEV